MDYSTTGHLDAGSLRIPTPLTPGYDRSVQSGGQIMPTTLLLVPTPTGFSDLPTTLGLGMHCYPALEVSSTNQDPDLLTRFLTYQGWAGGLQRRRAALLLNHSDFQTLRRPCIQKDLSHSATIQLSELRDIVLTYLLRYLILIATQELQKKIIMLLRK